MVAYHIGRVECCMPVVFILPKTTELHQACIQLCHFLR